MGKEQELLQAARTGNMTVIEKIMNHRQKRSGPLSLAPLASLRRSTNTNCQDTNGDTPLHHAALNGHREVVECLLANEASANVVDHKGCYPLHLGAWNGHSNICKILLTQGPSLAKVNEQNYQGETALHCAAQYGHAEVVNILLLHHADPTIRNNHQESPLDLAAQYGRIEAVQLLLRKHPTLLADKIDNVSPLHLASRNGHRNVVQVLLENGFNINTRTDTGTALHEAALFGKQDVVRLLLENGINTELTDSENCTAIEVLSEHSSQISLEIGKIILEHLEKQRETILKQLRSGRNSREQQRHSSAIYDSIPETRHSQPPLLRSLGTSNIACATATHCQSSPALYSRPNKPQHKLRDFNGSKESVSSAKSSTSEPPPVPPRRSDCYEDEDPIYDTPTSVIAIPRVSTSRSPVNSESELLSFSPGSSPGFLTGNPSPKDSPTLQETPKKPPRRKLMNQKRMVKNSENNKNGASSGSQAALRPVSNSRCHNAGSSPANSRPNSGDSLQSDNSSLMSEKSLGMDNRTNIDFSQQRHSRLDCAVKDKNDNTTVKQDHVQQDQHSPDNIAALDNNNPDMGCTDRGECGVISRTPTLRRGNNSGGGGDGRDVREMQRSSKRDGFVENVRDSLPEQDQEGNIWEQNVERPCRDSMVQDEDMKSVTSTTSSRPPSLDLGSKRSSREVGPLSPSGYHQPPTPDHPPPSPSTAVLGIQLQINPKEKRRSRDMETITELEYMASAVSSCGSEEPDGNQATSNPPKQMTDSQTETDLQDLVRSGGLDPEEEAACVGAAEERDDVGDILPSQKHPFLGLTKGSLPVGQRRVKSQIYDNIIIHPIAKQKKRISAPGGYAGFDPLMEREEGLEREGQGTPQTGDRDRDRDTGETDATADDSKRDKSLHDVNLNVEKMGSASGLKDAQNLEEEQLDENEEWAKIADIMSSYGGRMTMTEPSGDNGYFERRLRQLSQEKESTKRIQSVGEWLEDIGLPQYENILVANGFDDMDFLGSNVLEEQDLLEMGVLREDHRSRIMTASASLPQLKSIVEGTVPVSVEAWLASLRLAEYNDTFQVNNFTSMDRVRNVWELELNSVLDITTLGHRKRILASLRIPQDPDSSSQGEEFVDLTNPLNWKYRPSEPVNQFGDLDLFKDYTKEAPSRSQPQSQPPQQTQSQTPDEALEPEPNGTAESQEEVEEVIDLRPPHITHTESPIRQWRHRPEVLIKGCCNYSAHYLGSTLVKSLQGTESTKESINKMKKSTDNIAKVPTIILSISYRGVKFIDAKSKRVICEHDISNIFCACQDGDNLNYFAYITKDLFSDRHYCHVFSVRSTELATEIILTLGEAFEVAYQVVMRERGYPEGDEEGDDLREGYRDAPSPAEVSSKEPASQQQMAPVTVQRMTTIESDC